jgi:two-component system, LytTR family, sensor kinase
MEILSDFFLRLYPLEGVSLKRRILLHCLFWFVMFVAFWFGIGLPSSTFVYRILTATYLTVLDSTFFYLLAYVFSYIAKRHTGFNKILLIIGSIVLFYFWVAIISYARAALIIENNWLSAQNNRMYGYIQQYYQAGFWSYFKVPIIVSDTYEIASTSLPAFFLKFTRNFAKNLAEKKQLEIDFLRLQINPHFLVNTLNNIYSLVVIDDKRSPDAILSLSNLLDYVLYESSLPEVSMEKEIQFLQDFIELEKIRSLKKSSIEFNVIGVIYGNIAPLILIAFIENAFKHGMGDSTLHNFVRVRLELNEKTLHFEVVNSKPTQVSAKRKTSLGGIGLTNVRRRLASLYPNDYTLSIKDERNIYTINLVLKLK